MAEESITVPKSALIPALDFFWSSKSRSQDAGELGLFNFETIRGY